MKAMKAWLSILHSFFFNTAALSLQSLFTGDWN
jgi:hypothetical protein